MAARGESSGRERVGAQEEKIYTGPASCDGGTHGALAVGEG